VDNSQFFIFEKNLKIEDPAIGGIKIKKLFSFEAGGGETPTYVPM
jgi:hypothetical protein